MTIRDLLNKIQKEKPSPFTEAELIAFVNEIEAEVAEQLGTEEVPSYEDNHDDLDETLLAPAPYDRLYISYVKMQIDYSNEEYDSYQNNQAQHAQDFRDFTDWVVRERKAERTSMRFVNVF